MGLALEGQGVNLADGAISDARGATLRTLLGLGANWDDVQTQLTFYRRSIFGDTENKGLNLRQSWIRIEIAEAFVKISNIFDALEVKVGRQFYGDIDSPVMYIGPDYGVAMPNTYSSYDGVTARYNGEDLTLTAVYFDVSNSSLTDNRILAISGLDLIYKLSESVSAKAYVYDTRQSSNDFGVWGVKPTFDYEHFKFDVEYARNYGQHEKGWLAKANLALSMGTEETQFTPHVTYVKSEKGFEARGDFHPSYAGMFYGNIYADVFRGNGYDWALLNAGLSMKVADLEKWDFCLDFYTMDLEKHWNGNVWEAKVVYNLNQYVAFNATGAVLTNKKHFTASPTAIQLGMNVKF
ncbi:MAG: hypothetical protein J5594_05855 [Elusimicrobiaceae bacterium]|nr:hypothetical protein [Elusimicrobiaceae bacterium]